jgi:hypothetical protein
METELPSTDDHIINENGDLFGTNDEEMNVTSDTFFPFIELGCSVEDHQVILCDRHQTNTQWRNVEPPSNSNVSATIDGACQIIWEHAKYEIKCCSEQSEIYVGIT